MLTIISLIVANAILALAAFVLAAYALALGNIFFTFGREGTAKIVVRGDVFDHVLLFWSGHRLNDPRRLDYNSSKPAWEILQTSNPDAKPSPYTSWQLHWILLAKLGVYWYGLTPFKKIYRYEFEWTEQKIGDEGQPMPWHRNEWTDFIYVKGFPYWVKLEEAEDKDNEPLTLNYLLTTRCNNPYKALFKIEDWLDRVTADANNRVKVYVGEHVFNEIKREGEVNSSAMSGLTIGVCSINDNLLTEPGAGGAPMSYGITVAAASLVSISPAGTVKVEVEQALVAKRVAQLNAEAAVATAKGEAKATQERAKGQAKAIDTVYEKVKGYGELGLALRQLDTLQTSAASPNTTLIWANNPLAGVADWFKGASKSPTGTGDTPPTNP